MESDRFDALTRSIASRRSFVTKVGGGGLGAALIGTLGLREEATAATSCLLDLRLFVRVGPSAGFPLVATQTKPGQLVGQLRLTIGSKGDLSGSTFVLADGSSFPVVGSVSGHQIGLRIALAQGQTLVLQGVDDGVVSSCHGALDGGLVGPQEGDLGDWHASVVPSTTVPTATAQSVAPTPIPASSGGTGGVTFPTDTPPPSTDTSTSVPDTPTDTPTEVSCPECSVPTRDQSGGSVCVPAANGTVCSIGLCCGGKCSNEDLDPNNCGGCGNVCESHCCYGGVCCPLCGPGYSNCQLTCVDFANDRNNCGSCGNACAAGSVCDNGTCEKIIVCPTGWKNCGGVCVHANVCP